MTSESSTSDSRPFGPDAPRWTHPIRGVFGLLCSWSILTVLLLVCLVLALITFRFRVTSYFYLVARLFGLIHLWCLGLRIEVINPDAIKGRRCRVVSFNHASQLDLFIMASLLPPGGTPLVKREFLYIPILGQVIYAFDVTTIDRGNIAKAKSTLRRAVQKALAQEESLFIAPEGTRSRSGELGPFKMGAFYLAESLSAPIVPAVIRGAGECHPMGKWFCTPGVIQVEFLDEVSSEDFVRGDLHRHRDALRSTYLKALGAAEDDGKTEPG